MKRNKFWGVLFISLLVVLLGVHFSTFSMMAEQPMDTEIFPSMYEVICDTPLLGMDRYNDKNALWVVEPPVNASENIGSSVMMADGLFALVNNRSKFITALPQLVNHMAFASVQVYDNLDLGYMNKPFVITVSVEETTLPKGETFIVDVELRNNSEKDYNLYYTVPFFFVPFIPDWDYFGGIVIDPPKPRSKLFEAYSVINWRLVLRNPLISGVFLEIGEHELIVRAMFSLNSGQDNPERQHITLWSEPVKLTVHTVSNLRCEKICSGSI